jgi:hypothetical protein
MLDQFLQELFAPDQSQGWSPMSASSNPPQQEPSAWRVQSWDRQNPDGTPNPSEFQQRFDAMPGANNSPNDISALLPRGTNFTPTPGMLPPAGGGNQPQPPTSEMMPGGNQPQGQPPTPFMLPGGGGNPPLTEPPNPLMPPDSGNSPTTEDLSARSAMPPGGGPSGDSVGKTAGDPGSIDPNAGQPGGGQPGAQPGGGQGSGNPIFDRLAGVFGTKLLNAAQSGHPEARSVLGRLMGMDQRGDQQMRASLAGGMAGGNPNFKLGAAMKGAGGAMGGGLGQENLQDQRDVQQSQVARQQANFERTQSDKEQTQAALRKLYGARADYATTGRPNNSWNKPASQRWNDANRIINEKQKQLNASSSLLGMNKAERDAAKAASVKELADFKRQTYQVNGFTPDGQDAGPQAPGNDVPGTTGPRAGGPVPSTAKVVGDQEAIDRGLYDKPGMTGSGTYPDPHVLGGSTDDEQRQQFSGIKSGAIFINPKTYNDAIDEGLSPDEATRRATMSKQ